MSDNQNTDGNQTSQAAQNAAKEIEMNKNMYAVESTSAFTAFSPAAEALCQQLATLVLGKVGFPRRYSLHSYRHGGMDVLTLNWKSADKDFSIAWTPAPETDLLFAELTQLHGAVEIRVTDSTDAILLSQRIIDIVEQTVVSQ